MAHQSAPVPLNLDASCGLFLTYRDFVECGVTWQRLSGVGSSTELGTIDNRPRDPRTVQAMERLCRDVLDPLAQHFGVKPQLTYGLACRELTRHIPARIAPKVDQHAGYELNSRGTRICARGGFAVDLLVPNISSRDVAVWLVRNTTFDRLYFYGDQRPIHVSVGPDESRLVVEMAIRADGRRGPVRRGDGEWL